MYELIDLVPYGNIARQLNPVTGCFHAVIGEKPILKTTMRELNDEIDLYSKRMAQAARRKTKPVHATLLLKTRAGFTLWEGDILGLSASNKAGETVRVHGNKPDAHWGTLFCLTPGDTGQYEATKALVDELTEHLGHVERLTKDLDRIQRSMINVRVPFVTRVDEAVEKEPDFLAHLKATLDECATKKQ